MILAVNSLKPRVLLFYIQCSVFFLRCLFSSHRPMKIIREKYKEKNISICKFNFYLALTSSAKPVAGFPWEYTQNNIRSALVLRARSKHITEIVDAVAVVLVTLLFPLFFSSYSFFILHSVWFNEFIYLLSSKLITMLLLLLLGFTMQLVLEKQ